MIKIKRIRVSEISSLVLAPDYPTWEIVPVSRHRAKSYVNNPRCSNDDVFLYLAYVGERLAGYRTIMPDLLSTRGGTIKVGWTSGVWVHTDYRRQGIANKLLYSAFKDWQGKLLYTNYSNESKALYDNTGRFVNVNTMNGTRTYLRPCLGKILPPKRNFLRKIKYIWKITDFVLSMFNVIPFIADSIKIKQDISLEYLSYPDDDVSSLFTKAAERTASKRTGKELRWIFRHPWLVSAPLGDRIGEKYHFSSSPKRFEQLIIKVFENNELLGFFICNLNDRFLSTPYIICHESETKLFARLILKHAAKIGAQRVTVYHESVSAEIKRMMPFKWLSLKQQRNFFASKELVDEFGDDKMIFFEGDGDCAFL